MRRFGLLISALVIAMGGSCYRRNDQTTKASISSQAGKSNEEKSPRREKRSTVVTVRTRLIRSQTLAERVELVAVFSGQKQVDVFSRVTGRLATLGPEEGQYVKQGSVLFHVERNDAGDSYLTTPITSPISGWVGRWLVPSVGTQVSGQQPVVTIVDDEKLKTSVQLPTAQWLRIAPTTPVEVKVNQESRPGTVIGIARAADPNASRGSVTIEINNANHRWKAGMVGLVSFDLDMRPRLVLPATSLIITDQGSFVYLVRENKAVRQLVQYSVIDNDQIEILEGLSDGAQVITEGANQVADGLSVQVIDEQVERKTL